MNFWTGGGSGREEKWFHKLEFIKTWNDINGSLAGRENELILFQKLSFSGGWREGREEEQESESCLSLWVDKKLAGKGG